MSEVCWDWNSLTTITSEYLYHRTANTDEGAWLDITAQGFWRNSRQSAFLDVWVLIHSHTPTNPYPCLHATEEMNKKRGVSTFNEKSWMFFSISILCVRCMGPMAEVVYKKFHVMICSKQTQSIIQSDNQLATYVAGSASHGLAPVLCVITLLNKPSSCHFPDPGPLLPVEYVTLQRWDLDLIMVWIALSLV